MSGLCDCPPGDAGAPRDGVAYRFVHAEQTDPRNFLPPAKLSPSRWINRAPECSDYALSMFLSVAQATRFYDELAQTYKKIRLTIGTHLAEVTLAATDGLATPADPDGHFDLHEYVGVDLQPRSSHIGSMGGQNG